MVSLSLSTLVVVVGAMAVLGMWFEAARAREAANRVAVDACRRRSLQLLDGTVALTGLRPRLGARGLTLERTYVFDYAPGLTGRASGFIIMLGRDVQHVGFESDGGA